MKMKCLLLSLLAAAGVANAASTTPLTLRLVPERDCVLRTDRDLVFRIELQAMDSRHPRSTPLNLAVVLDRSGSMQGAKLEKAKQAACVVLDHLAGDDRFSLVTYDNQVDVVIPSRVVSDADALKRRIDRIESGGSTALHAGVEAGASEVREFLKRENVNRVILLSDGLANVGPKRPSDLADLGRKLRDEGIQVTTVGLGDDYNEDLMVALAEASAANYYYVKDAESLPGIFEEELGQIKTIVARNLRIIIELPDGVEPIEILGYPDVRFRGQRAELPLSEISGGQKRHYLVRCRLPEKKTDEQAVATAKVAYLDTAAKDKRDISGRTVVRVTDDEETARRSVNQSVQIDTASAENLVVRERALKYADEGKIAAAVSELRRQAQANETLRSNSPKLESEADSLSGVADDLERAGSFDKRSRKEFQYDNYLQKKQR